MWIDLLVPVLAFLMVVGIVVLELSFWLLIVPFGLLFALLLSLVKDIAMLELKEK